MSGAKLKPCPFCGCNEEFVAVIPRRTMIAEKDVKNVYQIICTKCGAKTGSKKTEKEAEEAWNRRTGNDQRRVITDSKANTI